MPDQPPSNIQTPPPAWQPSPPTGQKRHAGIIIALIIILLLAGAGATYYFLIYSKQEADQNNNEAVDTELNSNSAAMDNQNENKALVNSNTNQVSPLINVNSLAVNQTTTNSNVNRAVNNNVNTVNTAANTNSTANQNAVQNSNSSFGGNINTNAASYSSDDDIDGIPQSIEEAWYQTNPLASDSDNDGYSDLDELKNCYNPNGSGRIDINYYINTYCPFVWANVSPDFNNAVSVDELCTFWGPFAGSYIDSVIRGDVNNDEITGILTLYNASCQLTIDWWNSQDIELVDRWAEYETEELCDSMQQITYLVCGINENTFSE